jgi:hypothetical protein
MAILTSADVTTITNAMLGVLNKGGTALLQYVQSEAAKFAQSIETIGQLYAQKLIDQPEASAQITLQQNASQTVLTSAEGIGVVLAGQAINAGLNAVAGIVNKAIGFALL